MLFYLQNVVNSRSIHGQKYFYEMIFTSSRHCETQATWENLLFTVPIIKLRMFGGRNSKIGASMEAKTQVISNCTLFLIS